MVSSPSLRFLTGLFFSSSVVSLNACIGSVLSAMFPSFIHQMRPVGNGSIEGTTSALNPVTG